MPEAKKTTTRKKSPAKQPAVDAAPAAATETPAEGAPAAEAQIEVTGPRVFVVGPNKIVENDATTGLTNEQVRSFLQAAYPEVANATIRQRNDNGQAVVEFLPQPGRKG